MCFVRSLCHSWATYISCITLRVCPTTIYRSLNFSCQWNTVTTNKMRRSRLPVIILWQSAALTPCHSVDPHLAILYHSAVSSLWWLMHYTPAIDTVSHKHISSFWNYEPGKIQSNFKKFTEYYFTSLLTALPIIQTHHSENAELLFSNMPTIQHAVLQISALASRHAVNLNIFDRHNHILTATKDKTTDNNFFCVFLFCILYFVFVCVLTACIFYF